MGQWMELTAASCCFSILGCCIQWLHAYITNCRADVWWAFFQTIRPSGLCQRSGISIHYLWDVVSRDALDTTLRSLNVYLPGKASDFFFSFYFCQADYILGNNPLKMSFLVGYGKKYPQYVHHRGASIPADAMTGCRDGFKWLDSKKPNPNVAVGGLVGGPFLNETYIDSRNNSMQAEPSTYNGAVIVGLLSSLVTTSSAVQSFT